MANISHNPLHFGGGFGTNTNKIVKKATNMADVQRGLDKWSH